MNVYYIIILIVWNMFIKRYVIGFLLKLFGDKFMVENKSFEELYDEQLNYQSFFQTYVIQSFIWPTGIFIILYLFLSL